MVGRRAGWKPWEPGSFALYPSCPCLRPPCPPDSRAIQPHALHGELPTCHRKAFRARHVARGDGSLKRQGVRFIPSVSLFLKNASVRYGDFLTKLFFCTFISKKCKSARVSGCSVTGSRGSSSSWSPCWASWPHVSAWLMTCAEALPLQQLMPWSSDAPVNTRPCHSSLSKLLPSPQLTYGECS